MTVPTPADSPAAEPPESAAVQTAETAQKRWAEPMRATHTVDDDVWVIEAHDDQSIEDGKQYAADLRVLLLLNGERYREFTYPSYRIWTLYAHWTEGLPDLTTRPTQDRA